MRRGEISAAWQHPFADIETKWQEYLLWNKTTKTPDLAELAMAKPESYILDIFLYLSGAGLHVGHPGVLLPLC